MGYRAGDVEVRLGVRLAEREMPLRCGGQGTGSFRALQASGAVLTTHRATNLLSRYF